MTTEQFRFLTSTFGNSSLPESERWKCTRYIYVENPICDVETLMKRGEIIYIDNSEIGAGFYIIGKANSDFGIFNNSTVVTFIPIEVIDKVAISLDNLDVNFGKEGEIDLSDETVDNKLMINNIELSEDDKLVLAKVYNSNYTTNDEFMYLIG